MTTKTIPEEKSTTIDGYRCELFFEHEPANESGYASSCHISKGRHCASLSLIEACGGFDDGEEGENDIRPATVERIAAWADKNGY